MAEIFSTLPYAAGNGSTAEGWADPWEELTIWDTDATAFSQLDSGYLRHEESWFNMHGWASSLFPTEAIDTAAVEDVEAEIKAAGGVRFCCYGSVPGIQVKLVGNMTNLDSRIDYGQDLQSFEVSKFSDYFMLKFPDQSLFAQASEFISRGLDSLNSIESVEVRAFVSTRSIQHVFQHAKKPGEAKLKVDMNFYGSAEDARLVGEQLSAAKTYLQDPDHGVPDVEYLNPHVIYFDGIEEPASRNVESNIFQTTAPPMESLEQRDEEGLVGTVATLFRSLTRFRHLERAAAGSQVITELLPHQESALYFMLQRENGPIPQEYSLWAPERQIQTPIFRHKLTQAESQDLPDELGGGILADAPGMGKTLSALALIIATLAQAQAWSWERALNPRKARTQATLVIVPSTLIMNQWAEQIDKHLDKTILVSRYYGKARNDGLKQYLDTNIVFTTYHTIAVDMNGPDSLAFRLDWFRIVLDEGNNNAQTQIYRYKSGLTSSSAAHMIRRRETTLYQGASQLSARSRWCLTGTPIQNHLEDVGSLLAFLRVSEIENKAVFRNHIITPFADDTKMAASRFAMLLDCVCLRRSQDLLHLPTIDENYHFVDLSDDEREQYDDTLAHMTRLIKEKVSRGTGKRNPFGIFQAQLQLRLVCNHGTFQRIFEPHKSRDREAENESLLYTLGTNAEVSCSHCGVPVPVFELVAITGRQQRCQHTLCQECVRDGLETSESISGRSSAQCTICSRQASQGPGAWDHSGEEKKPYFKEAGFSSKIAALMDDLNQVAKDSKSIVFSCWTKTLDLVEIHFKERGILYSRIDGNQLLPQRQSNMDMFTTDSSVPILLMSTGVGAFGLNLTAASNVFILEPQWNPSVESQAVGRVSRLGQEKPVKVIRYLVRRTVEVKMHTQQLRKLELAKLGSLGHSISRG